MVVAGVRDGGMTTLHRIFAALKGGKRMTLDEMMTVEVFASKQTLGWALSQYSTGDAPYLARQKRIGNGPYEYWIDPDADLPADLREIAEGKKSPPPLVPAAARPEDVARSDPPPPAATPKKRASAPAPKPIFPKKDAASIAADRMLNAVALAPTPAPPEGPIAGDKAAGTPAGPAASASPAAPGVLASLGDCRAPNQKPGAFEYADVLDDLRYKRLLLDNAIAAIEALVEVA
jgi:hypothetical protein